MKWAIGGAAVFFFFYFLGVPIFNAMKKHDYDAIYHGMRDARRSAGAFVQEEDKPYVSYAEDYVYGRN